MVSKLNEFDLAFVVDTTGSMGGLISAAQQQMVQMVDTLATAVDVDMHLGVVEYRDHPPQDTMVYRVYPFTENLKKAKKNISRLAASGGGDAPEAVYAGVVAACHELAWRQHACRMAVLVGDAPPHGVGCAGDGFPRGCPSGETMETVSAKAEEARVRIYSLGLTACCHASFERISRLTGGQFFPSRDAGVAMNQMQDILQREFGQLDFARDVFQAWQQVKDPCIDTVADQLGKAPVKIASAVCRLQSRGFLLPEEKTASS